MCPCPKVTFKPIYLKVIEMTTHLSTTHTTTQLTQKKCVLPQNSKVLCVFCLDYETSSEGTQVQILYHSPNVHTQLTNRMQYNHGLSNRMQYNTNSITTFVVVIEKLTSTYLKITVVTNTFTTDETLSTI